MQGERLPCKGNWLGAAETEGLYHRTPPACGHLPFQGRQDLGSFFAEPLEPIRNGFYFFGRRSVDSRAQMCYDDAIQSGMCL